MMIPEAVTEEWLNSFIFKFLFRDKYFWCLKLRNKSVFEVHLVSRVNLLLLLLVVVVVVVVVVEPTETASVVVVLENNLNFK